MSKFKVIKYIFLFNISIFILLIGMYLSLLSQLKKNYAVQFTKNNRNTLLVGDLRTFETAKRSIEKFSFKEIKYIPEIRHKNFSGSQINKIVIDFTDGKISIPLYFNKKSSDKKLGDLIFIYDKTKYFNNLITIWVVIFIFSVPFIISFIQRSERKYNLEIDFQKNKVIAQTTQMLAHDVRKPFSMVSSMLNMLESSPNEEKTKGLITRFTPEVKRAITSVNGMITDVMEVGSNKPLDKTPTKVEGLIKTTLIDIFRYSSKANINLKYEFNHTKMIDADSMKILRVLTNITNNAVEAMKFSGDIWFKTRDIENDYIEITIGNNNSLIQKEDLDHLFDAFYTKGKKSGTGLGLAIVQKIIKSHGGKIHCESSENVGTEFILTLPSVIDSAYLPENNLLKHSHDFNETDSIIPDNNETPVVVKTNKHIVYLDDNVMLMEPWMKFKEIKVVTYTSPLIFYKDLKENPSVLNDALCVVTDYYFDEEYDKNGLEFSKDLIKSGYKGPIFLASDGVFNKEDLEGTIIAQVSKDPREAWIVIQDNIFKK